MMKQILLILFILTILRESYSQDYRLARPDSLESLLTTVGKPEKAEILARLALHYTHSDTERAAKYAEEAIILAGEEDNIHASGLAHLCNGILAIEKGNIPSAFDLLLQAENELRNTDDNLMLGHARREICIIYYFTGDVDGYITWGFKTLEPYRKAKALYDLAMVYWGLGYYYNNFSTDYPTGIIYLKRADSLALGNYISPAIRGGDTDFTRTGTCQEEKLR